MPFATALKDSLLARQRQVPAELAQGDDLSRVLGRHLLAVEAAADRELLTSILLLDEEGQRLWHGAAPNLPAEYCRAIDGAQIGPCAGSCGTAAYLDRPVYVTDIETDPLWADYRDIALPHGLRACWSTPIRDGDGTVMGTFAIYHRTVGSPTSDEVEAIQMITDHVANAITRARQRHDIERRGPRHRPGSPTLRLVSNGSVAHPPPEWADGLRQIVAKIEAHADVLERCAKVQGPGPAADVIESAVTACRSLIEIVRRQLEP